MSGGSYDYLYCKEIDSLVGYDAVLQEMADDLASLGYAADAAQETQRLLEDIRAFRNRAETKLSRLSDVWKAKEWWRSCDSGEDEFKAALENYREDKK